MCQVHAVPICLCPSYASDCLHCPLLQRDRTSDRPYFNPEEHISEKREWSRRYTQSQGGAPGVGLAAPKPPDRLYEHFAVVVRSGAEVSVPLGVQGIASAT